MATALLGWVGCSVEDGGPGFVRKARLEQRFQRMKIAHRVLEGECAREFALF